MTLTMTSERSAQSRSRYGVPFTTPRRATAFGAESGSVQKIEQSIFNSFYVLASYPPPLEIEFLECVLRWKIETLFESSPYRMASHPAYRRIIAMGWPVVPSILMLLRSEPDFWFEALVAISGEQPVPLEHAGDLDAMTKDWLEWGRALGL
jgi:hypothetical protein